MLAGDEITCGFPLGHAKIEKPHDRALDPGGVVLIVTLRQDRDPLCLQHGVRLPRGYAHELPLLTRGGRQISIARIRHIADREHRRQMADEIGLHIGLPMEPVAGFSKQGGQL